MVPQQQGQQQRTVYTLSCAFDQDWDQAKINNLKRELEQKAQQLGSDVEFAISQVPLNTRQ